MNLLERKPKSSNTKQAPHKQPHEKSRKEITASLRLGNEFRQDFLHGWRRHVCRDCTGHLALVKRELRARLQKQRTTNKNQNQ